MSEVEASPPGKTVPMELITSSRLKVYRNECRRKHKLMYHDGWRPVREEEYFAVGSLVHEGLAAWWLTPSADERLDAALSAVKGRAENEYQQGTVEELLIGYDTRWAGEMDRFEMLLVEREFVAPLINPETMAASRTFRFAGKIDVLVRDRIDQGIVLIEHKTTIDTIDDPTALYWTKLQMEGQVSHYYIGAETLGHQVNGCIYDVIKKPGMKPLKATPIEIRKYTKEGKLYANQREEDETAGEYRRRIRDDIQGNLDKYFQRRSVPRLESELREYLSDAWALARSMREDELAGRAPRNPDACHRFGTCAFWELCASGVKPEEHPDRYHRIENVHPELQEVA